MPKVKKKFVPYELKFEPLTHNGNEYIRIEELNNIVVNFEILKEQTGAHATIIKESIIAAVEEIKSTYLEQATKLKFAFQNPSKFNADNFAKSDEVIFNIFIDTLSKMKGINDNLINLSHMPIDYVFENHTGKSVLTPDEEDTIN